MNKEIEEWIGQNMPDNDCHPVFIGGWMQGATAMAEHLEEKNREENDAAFLLGVEAQKNQPPTDGQIDKFLALYNKYCHVPSATLKEYPTAKEYIKAHWNYDETIKRIEEIEKQIKQQ